MVIAALALGTFGAAAAAEPLIRHDVYPLRLKPRGEQPKVTGLDTNRDQEALAYVLVAVAADGKVTNARVVGGFVTPAQIVGAQTLAKRLTFLPRLVDGKPVESSGIVPIQMVLYKGEANPHNLDASLQGVVQLLNGHKWSEALQSMDQMLSKEVKTVGVYLIMESLRAEAYEGIGNTEEALLHATHALGCRNLSTSGGISYCDGRGSLASQTLMRSVRLQRLLGRYGDALQSYAELEKIETADTLRPFAKEVSRLRLLATGDEAVSAWLQLDESGLAETHLFRGTVALGEVTDGSVEGASLECKAADVKKLSLFSYDLPLAAQSWTVPPEAKACSIQISGKAGTRVRIVQVGASTLDP